MRDKSAGRRLVFTWESVFILLTAAAIGAWAANASAFTLRTTPMAWVLAAAGLYVILGMAGGRAVARLPAAWRLPVLLAYYAVQGGLGFSVVYWLGGGNSSGVLILPLAGQTVTHFGRRGVLAISLLICLGYGGVYYSLRPDIVYAAQSSLVYIAGVIAAIAFGALAQQEAAGRAEVERLAGELRAHAAQVEELATTQERNRLAREIHDTLGHYLSSLALQIQGARVTLEQSALGPPVPEALNALGKAEALAQEALTDVRRSVRALRSTPTIDGPLPESMARLVEAARQPGILETSFELAGPPRPLAAPVELALYRAAQEGLTNVRRHAHARKAQVTLRYTPRRVSLRIADDGIGAKDQSGGFGLVGLRERVGLVGGELRVSTSPGQGFELLVDLNSA